ncbi:MAG TPA: glycosyltransferase [Acidimicrobiales bacterium]|nr:glycosyltransferase [Acidimicrobiales bacterium]
MATSVGQQQVEGRAEEPQRRPALSVVALVPRTSLGRQRDAFAAAVLEVLEKLDVPVRVVTGRTRTAAAGSAAGVVSRARSEPPTHVLCFDPALAPVAAAIHMVSGRRPRLLLFCTGTDLIDAGPLSQAVMGRLPIRLVATDGAAGAALSARYGPVDLLRPSVDEEAYRALLSLEPTPEPDSTNPPALLSFMPLDAAGESGVMTLLRAVELVRARHADLNLTIAGPGQPTSELTRALAERATWATALTSTDLFDLRAALARCHLFVVPGRRSGLAHRPDDFGIPLIHAQLAATPVIAPPDGSGSDAFVEGITGIRPVNATAESLARCILTFLDHESVLQRTARNARLWASFGCAPGRFATQVRQIVLNAEPDEIRMPALALVSPLP